MFNNRIKSINPQPTINGRPSYAKQRSAVAQKLLTIPESNIMSNMYSGGQDTVVYEVEIIDKKAEQNYQIQKAAENGICVCKRWHFILIGNLVIVGLVGLIFAITLVLNIPKDNIVQPLGINATCTVGSNDCDTTPDLVCKSGTCQCNGNKYWNITVCECAANTYWDGYNCISNKLYTQACSSSYPCMNYLICNGTICMCNSTQFFNVSNCYNKKAYGQACSSYAECQDYLGMTCQTSVCNCSSTYYWNGSICVQKLLNGSSCTQHIECDDTKFLSCTSNLCLCNTTYYWDLNYTICKTLKSYDDTCYWSYQCKSTLNLLCQTTANSCNCPSTSVVGMCDCPTTSFWDSTTCVTRKSINGTCSQDYMCTYGKNLKCSSGSCVCTSTYPTWSGSTCI